MGHGTETYTEYEANKMATSKHYVSVSRYTIIESVDVNFNQFNRRVDVTVSMASTDSHFDIDRRCLRQLFAEPRRGVELTAGTGGPTSLPIPEGVIGVKYSW